MAANGTKGDGLPRWRFLFFAALLLIVVIGGKYLDIPREVSVPIIVGCLFALANGVLPSWLGRNKDQ